MKLPLLLLPLLVIGVLIYGFPFSPAAALAASISGTIWLDENGDGQRQQAEIGIGGVPVALRRVDTGQTQNAVSNADGTYAFPSVEAGSYSLSLRLGIPNDAPRFSTFPVRQLEGVLPVGVAIGADGAHIQDFGIYPAEKAPRFSGFVTIDGQTATSRADVRPFVDGKECGIDFPVLPPNLPASAYELRVVLSELISGCGSPGKVVSFTVNGRTANETAAWQTGDRTLNLSVGSAPTQTLGPSTTQATPTSSAATAPSIIRPPDTGTGGLLR